MKPRAAVTVGPGDRTTAELVENVGKETPELAEDLRQREDQDHWNTVAKAVPLKQAP